MDSLRNSLCPFCQASLEYATGEYDKPFAAGYTCGTTKSQEHAKPIRFRQGRECVLRRKDPTRGESVNTPGAATSTPSKSENTH